jgi:hypothetical protein
MPSDIRTRPGHTSLPDPDLSGPHINELVAALPEWLRRTANEAAVEARMLVCVVERLATRYGELEMCLELALHEETSGVDDGGALINAVGAEIGFQELFECLMGSAAIAGHATACMPSAADRESAFKHARQHREENGEPLLLRGLSDFYTRTKSA